MKPLRETGQEAGISRSNHTITNPVIGHQIIFLQTAAQTGGALLQIEYVVEKPETKPAIPLHKHLQCQERFEALRGKLGVIIEGDRQILEPGQSATIPTNTAHTFWNAGAGELRFITEVRPAGELQTYWETVFGLAQDGKAGANGLPNILQLAVVAPLADSYDPRLPVGLTRALIAMFGTLGRIMGYQARYPEYSDETSLTQASGT